MLAQGKRSGKGKVVRHGGEIDAETVQDGKAG